MLLTLEWIQPSNGHACLSPAKVWMETLSSMPGTAELLPKTCLIDKKRPWLTILSHLWHSKRLHLITSSEMELICLSLQIITVNFSKLINWVPSCQRQCLPNWKPFLLSMECQWYSYLIMADRIPQHSFWDLQRHGDSGTSNQVQSIRNPTD